MKKNRTVLTVFLIIVTGVLLGATVYISSLLSSPSSPTQIRKTKAAAVTYTRKVDLFAAVPTDIPTPTKSFTTNSSPTAIPTIINTIPTIVPTKVQIASSQMPSSVPTKLPSAAPLPTAVIAPTAIPTVVKTQSIPSPLPTLQPLLAYKSTTISPTLIPVTNTGGMADPTKTPSPTIKKAQPTGTQQLPETGWIQTSTILFIVATSTILFSLLF